MPRGEDAVFAELLRRVVGVTDGAARAYVKGRTGMLGDATLAAMDIIAEALGRSRPDRVETKTGRQSTRHGVVLFTRLDGVPSPRFHLEVANCLVEAGSLRSYPVSIHVPGGEERCGIHVPGGEEHCGVWEIARLLRLLNPRAAVWLRESPGPAELATLRAYETYPWSSCIAIQCRFQFPL
ncbi:MAG TPA: hypothetical protein VIY49_08100 [Bryobacteraceae bacterium]